MNALSENPVVPGDLAAEHVDLIDKLININAQRVGRPGLHHVDVANVLMDGRDLRRLRQYWQGRDDELRRQIIYLAMQRACGNGDTASFMELFGQDYRTDRDGQPVAIDPYHLGELVLEAAKVGSLDIIREIVAVGELDQKKLAYVAEQAVRSDQWAVYELLLDRLTEDREKVAVKCAKVAKEYGNHRLARRIWTMLGMTPAMAEALITG